MSCSATGIQVLDVAVRIGRHDRVADRLQRDLRTLLLVEQRALGGLALRDVRDRAFVSTAPARRRRRHDARVLDDDDRAPDRAAAADTRSCGRARSS